MKFSHCEDERGDRHLDILTDEENGLESSSHERTLSKSRSKRRTLCGGVVRWRTVSLPGTVLGLTDHHEQCPFQDKKGTQTIGPSDAFACRHYHDFAACLIRLKQSFPLLYRHVYIKKPQSGIEPQCGFFSLVAFNGRRGTHGIPRP